MGETIHVNFTILTETNEKLAKIAGETFLRSKGNVVDLAVSDLWKKLHPGEEAIEPLVVSGEALQKEP